MRSSRRSDQRAGRDAPDWHDAQISLPLFDSTGSMLTSPALPVAQGPSPAASGGLEPAAPPASGPTPHRLLRHLRSNREVRLGEHLIGYELKRARRRTIGFVVGPEGLAVSVPRWVGQVEIDQALQAKSQWILRKLADQRSRLERLEAARVDWRDGVSLPFLGSPMVVQLDPTVTGALFQAQPRQLRVGLPTRAEPAQIRDAVQGWLQQQALALFEQRCAFYAERLRVRIRRLRLSSAQTRWGSASADGTVRLNWRLIHFALPTIDYVVAHELAHLHEMNHSPAFWEVVRSVMPDYEARRGTLKDGQVPVYD
jgi:predicted metal-dependent hydrolase